MLACAWATVVLSLLKMSGQTTTVSGDRGASVCGPLELLPVAACNGGFRLT